MAEGTLGGAGRREVVRLAAPIKGPCEVRNKFRATASRGKITAPDLAPMSEFRRTFSHG